MQDPIQKGGGPQKGAHAFRIKGDGPLLLGCLLLLSLLASAAFGIEISNQGNTGLLTLPSARTLENGKIVVGAGFAWPHNVYYANLGYFEFLEVGLKLTDVLTYDLGDIDPDWAGFGTFKDRSIDCKLRLLNESDNGVALAIGGQDLIGTRVFGSYYAVLSKDFGLLDLSLGYGLEGLAGWFGGTSVPLPWWQGVSLILEGNQSGLKTAPEGFYPRNFVGGVRFEPFSDFQIDIAMDNNLRVMANGALQISLDQHLFPWQADVIFDEDIEEGKYEQVSPTEVSGKILWYAKQEGFINLAAQLTPGSFSVEYENTHYYSDIKALGRMMRIGFGLTPLDVKKGYFIPKVKNVRTLIIEVDRKMYLDYMFDRISDKEFADSLVFYGPVEFMEVSAYRPPTRRSQFYRNFWVLPGLENHFGDQDNFYKFRLSVDLMGYTELWNGGSLYSMIKVPFYNTMDSAYKNLNTRLYYGTLSQFLNFSHDYYGDIQVGYLSESFFGLNLEVLKLVAEERIGVGFDYSRVMVRDQYSFMGFDPTDNYDSLVGSGYLKLPELDFDAGLKVGRFVYGDDGFRLEAIRYFGNATIGFWFSRTNFGDIYGNSDFEDKGITVSIPMNLFYDHDSRETFYTSVAPWGTYAGYLTNPGSPVLATLRELDETDIKVWIYKVKE